MTNKDMVKAVDPAVAKSPGPERSAADRAATEPRDGPPPEQFPPDADPQDSNQLKPMLNAKKNPGLRSG